MKIAFYVAVIVISIILIAVLILQGRGGGVSGVFGGWGTSTYGTRRGIERILFRATIVLAALFVIVAALGVWAGP